MQGKSTMKVGIFFFVKKKEFYFLLNHPYNLN